MKLIVINYLLFTLKVKSMLIQVWNLSVTVGMILMSTDEVPLPIIEPVPAPESVGEEAAAMKATSPGILSNFSFTNLKTEIKNMKYVLHLYRSIHIYNYNTF